MKNIKLNNYYKLIIIKNTYQGSNSCMILSKRITANNREANPEIQASSKTVKVIRELSPAAFVNVEVFICLDVDFLSGNISFLVFVMDVLFGNIFPLNF